MTIFAVICALIYPGIHVGRVWFAYYLFPLPNQMAIWPNSKAPCLGLVRRRYLLHRVAALWFVGLIPRFWPFFVTVPQPGSGRSFMASSRLDGAAPIATGRTTSAPTSSWQLCRLRSC